MRISAALVCILYTEAGRMEQGSVQFTGCQISSFRLAGNGLSSKQGQQSTRQKPPSLFNQLAWRRNLVETANHAIAGAMNS